MNPYTSLWTGVRPGDGPQEFHLSCSTAGARTCSPTGRPPGAALHPLLGVPERVPGLRARRRPGLRVGLSGPDRRDPDAAAARPGRRRRRCRGRRRCAVPATRSARSRSTSPRCSCTCAGGSCARRSPRFTPEALAMKGMAAAFGSRRRYEAAQRLARLGRGPLAKAAVPGWTAMRDLPEPPKETFRDWWKNRRRHRARGLRTLPPPSTARRRRVSTAKADILARVRARSARRRSPGDPARVSRGRLAPPRRDRRPVLRDRRRVPRDRAPRAGIRGRGHGSSRSSAAARGSACRPGSRPRPST